MNLSKFYDSNESLYYSYAVLDFLDISSYGKLKLINSFTGVIVYLEELVLNAVSYYDYIEP